ncbi:MAG: CIA30 family protein [Gammaproteobacteria bacterium]
MSVQRLPSSPFRQRVRSIAFFVLAMVISPSNSADNTDLIIDDRSSGSLVSTIGTLWRGISDRVMGGLSTQQVSLDTLAGRPCVRLTGEVRLDNNGGFIQLALELAQEGLLDASDFAGLHLVVYGNGEQYNAHLRTSDLRLPWQSYRQSFVAPVDWTAIRLPFAGFKAHRTELPLALSRLKRLGIVAIGRPYQADLCIAKVSLYR